MVEGSFHSEMNKTVIGEKLNSTTTTIYFFYRFRLYKGLVPQIATKLVEVGQDEHENIMGKKKLQ